MNALRRNMLKRSLKSIDIGFSRFTLLVISIIVFFGNAGVVDWAASQPASALTMEQLEGLLRLKTPDRIIASEILSRGLAFAPDRGKIQRLRQMGAGPMTLSALQEVGEKQRPFDIHFKEENFPDAAVGESYSFAIVPLQGKAPFKVNVVRTFPPGLALNPTNMVIEGKPTEKGQWPLELHLHDSSGQRGRLVGTIRVFQVLTVGPHGTFKDANQMVFNAVQGMNEIRFEAGTYFATGLSIPQSKSFDGGIKISGGWDSTFRSVVENRENATIFDGSSKKDTVFRYFPSNFQNAIFLTFEYVTFQNAQGTAVEAGAPSKFSYCTFRNNSKFIDTGTARLSFDHCRFTGNSGANLQGPSDHSFNDCMFENNKYPMYGDGNFHNCTFRNNSEAAVRVKISASFANCTFENNSGGAVFGGGIFTKCKFTNNSAQSGGAIRGSGTFTDCLFIKNSAKFVGGAVETGRDSKFMRCIFIQNSAGDSGGAIRDPGVVENCLFVGNIAKGEKGGAILATSGYVADIINCSFYENRAQQMGGALYGAAKVLNSIFFRNFVGNKENDITAGFSFAVDYSLLNAMEGSADYGSHNIQGDPKFVSPDDGDFHIRPDSSCVGSGTTTPGKHPRPGYPPEVWEPFFGPQPVDLEGNPRITGGKINLGAYQRTCEKPCLANPLPVDVSRESTNTPSAPSQRTDSSLQRIQGQQSVPGCGDYQSCMDASNAALAAGNYSTALDFMNRALHVGNSISIPVCLESGWKCDLGRLFISASEVSFTDDKGQKVFSVRPSEIAILGTESRQILFSGTFSRFKFQVAGKKYNFEFIPSGIDGCIQGKYYSCPDPGTAQQEAVGRSVLLTIQGLAR